MDVPFGAAGLEAVVLEAVAPEAVVPEVVVLPCERSLLEVPDAVSVEPEGSLERAPPVPGAFFEVVLLPPPFSGLPVAGPPLIAVLSELAVASRLEVPELVPVEPDGSFERAPPVPGAFFPVVAPPPFSGLFFDAAVVEAQLPARGIPVPLAPELVCAPAVCVAALSASPSAAATAAVRSFSIVSRLQGEGSHGL